MAGTRRPLRRAVLFGVPFLYILLGLVHPTANPELGDKTDPFVRVHIAQLFLIMGLGYVLWLLVEGVAGRAATTARALMGRVPASTSGDLVPGGTRVTSPRWSGRRTETTGALAQGAPGPRHETACQERGLGATSRTITQLTCPLGRS